MAEELLVSEGSVVDERGRLVSLNVGSITVNGNSIQPGFQHDWRNEGWGSAYWRTQTVNNDGGTSNSLSVVADKGRITGHAAASPGNLRTAYERLGTEWEDSEITSLWWGGSIFDGAVATPQMGQFHRARFQSGRWCAVVVTNNIFATDVNVVNQNVWNYEPTNALNDELELGSQGGSKTYASEQLARRPSINAIQRVSFGGFFNQYFVQPVHLWGLTAGVTVTITSLDSTFVQATAQAIGAADAVTGSIQLEEFTTLSTSAFKADSGLITPTTESAKRYWPYWVKSQLQGTILRVKVWRYLEPEPDWASALAVIVQDFSLPTGGGGVAATPEPNARMPVGVGRCGLIGAHLRSSAYLEYGDTTFRQL